MTESLTLPRPRAAFGPVAARAARLWRGYTREVVGTAIFAIITTAALIGQSGSGERESAAPPAPPSMTVRPLAAEQAIKLNAETPLTSGANPPARPFVFSGNRTARAQAINCLANAVYYEAGNQDEDGGRAVAQVVLNRVRHPAFPGSVCGVVYEGSTRPTGCQFTFTCDGSLNRAPDAAGWRRASEIAERALSGSVFSPVGWATHYHADYVVPYWASTMAKNAIVGAHLFYRWAGGWGQPAVFNRAYSGREPNAGSLRAAAIAAVHVVAPQPGSLAATIDKIPGAEPLKLSPSLRGDKRVGVRFNLASRSASDGVKHQDYSKQFQISDNLKWSLSGGSGDGTQQPLGQHASAAETASGSDGASGQR